MAPGPVHVTLHGWLPLPHGLAAGTISCTVDVPAGAHVVLKLPLAGSPGVADLVRDLAG